MKILRILIAAINAYLDQYEAAMNEWKEANPEGYYNYIASSATDAFHSV